MPIRSLSLDDKYALESGDSYMSGIQALVRLPLEQMRRDSRLGLKTGCLISGYEGSPLGGYDLALLRAARFLDEHGIRFVPGVNEELALTAVMGSQLFQSFPEPLYDGAVGIWYGKGPGLDRSGDALRHANFAGIGENCGALALAGDDHVSKSSSIPHQSELSLYNCAVPVLNPSCTQEVLDFGLYGIAMSRFSGAWSGLKLSTDICDGGGIVEFGPDCCPVELPELLIDGEPYRKAMGLMLVVPYSLSLEAEVHEHRLQAAREFARLNRLNRICVRHASDRLGIVTTGKSYADLKSALRLLRVGDEELRSAGVRILKLGMSYPLEPTIVDEFATGLETVVVIEEKRSFVELQLREMLLQPIPPALGLRKEGRRRRDALPIARRARRRHDRAGAGQVPWTRGMPAAAAGSAGCGVSEDPRFQARERPANAQLLLRLPPQSIDPAARGAAGRRRHRMPRHGGPDAGSRAGHRVPFPHGFRRGLLDRRVPVHRDPSTSSRISVTGPTSIRGALPCRRLSRRESTSRSRSCTTTQSP